MSPLLVQVFDRDLGEGFSDELIGELFVDLANIDFSKGKVIKLYDKLLQNVPQVTLLNQIKKVKLVSKEKLTVLFTYFFMC